MFSVGVFIFFVGCYPISLFQRKMESTGSQVFIKEEMEEETKDVFSHILSPVPVKEEDPLER
jgi:hypothetical protein